MALTITPVAGSDPTAIEAYCEVIDACRRHDVPRWRETTIEMARQMVDAPFPDRNQEFHVAWLDGEPVGRVMVELPTLENLETMSADIWVVPAHRRRGLGRELFEFVRGVAGTKERKKIFGSTLWELPGIPAPNLAGARFAEALGFTSAMAEVTRRLDLSTMEETALEVMLADAQRHSAGYRLISWDGPPPEEYINDLAYLDARLMVDAPMGEMELEPPKPDPERVRGFHRSLTERRRLGYHTAAIHTETDRLVAWTTITRELSLAWHAFQQITIVEQEHRGHRLGALVKVANLHYLRANAPTVTAIDTFNADENVHMIAINEAMGFRPLYAWQNWQREI